MRTVEISVEFPGGTAGLGSCIVTVVVRVQSLAWELSHALGTAPPPTKRKIQWRKKLASMSLSCAGRLFWCQKNMQNLRLPSWMCFLYEINSTLLLAGVHMVMLRYPNPGAWEGSPRLFCWVALNISFLSICSHFRGYPHLQDFADSYRS